MKFEDALELVLEKMTEKTGKKTAATIETAKIAATVWNILAMAQNKLDDFVIISHNDSIINIHSIPIRDEKKKSNEKSPESNKNAKEDKN
jgi:hypothetical protein